MLYVFVHPHPLFCLALPSLNPCYTLALQLEADFIIIKNPYGPCTAVNYFEIVDQVKVALIAASDSNKAMEADESQDFCCCLVMALKLPSCQNILHLSPLVCH